MTPSSYTEPIMPSLPSIPTLPRFTAPVDGHLTAEMLSAYQRDGFLVLEGYKSAAECHALKERMAELIDSYTPGEEATIFSGAGGQPQARSEYFRQSGERISYFFEQGAFDAQGHLTKPVPLALNKVGHALHDLDPVFEAFSRDARLGRTAADIGLTNALIMQSMYIFKQAQIGGEVAWHQDSTFLTTEPMTCTGFWFALEDATAENGAMQGLAGAHEGGIRERMHYNASGELLMTRVDSAAWQDDWPERGGALIDVPQGTLVILHGQAPHRSCANTSDKSRHAYTLHVVDSNANWLPDNWIQRPNLPAKGFFSQTITT